MLKKVSALAVVVAASSAVFAQNAEVIVTPGDIVAINPFDEIAGSPDVESMITLDSDSFVFMNADEVGDTDGLPFIRADYQSGTDDYLLTKIAGRADVVNAITAAGGSDLSADGEDIRYMTADANGDLLVVIDTDNEGPSEAWLLRINGDGSGTTAIAGDVASPSTPNLVDGAIGVAAIGTTVYVFRNAAYGTATNIVAFDTTATDATQAGTEVATEAEVLAAFGVATAADLSLDDGGNIANSIDNSAFIIANGDDDGALVLAELGANPTDPLTLSSLLTGTQVASSLGSAPVIDGYESLVVGPNGDLYAQLSGGTTDGVDDLAEAIVVIQRAPSGNYQPAAIWVTSADLENATQTEGLGVFSDNEHSMAYDATSQKVLVSSDDAQAIIRFDPAPLFATVEEWIQY